MRGDWRTEADEVEKQEEPAGDRTQLGAQRPRLHLLKVAALAHLYDAENNVALDQATLAVVEHKDSVCYERSETAAGFSAEDLVSGSVIVTRGNYSTHTYVDQKI